MPAVVVPVVVVALVSLVVLLLLSALRRSQHRTLWGKVGGRLGAWGMPL